jgi:hypothetical protein
VLRGTNSVDEDELKKSNAPTWTGRNVGPASKRAMRRDFT